MIINRIHFNIKCFLWLGEILIVINVSIVWIPALQHKYYNGILAILEWFLQESRLTKKWKFYLSNRGIFNFNHMTHNWQKAFE